MSEEMTKQDAIERLAALWDNRHPLQCKAIDMAITALSAEPKIGHWVEYDDSAEVQCDQCHRVWSMFSNEVNTFLYCPNCGAKMEEIPTDCSNLDSCENCKYDDGECCRLLYEAKMKSMESEEQNAKH